MRNLVLCDARDLHPAWQPELLGGGLGDGGAGASGREVWDGALWREMGAIPTPAWQAVKLRAIPYHLWANRGRGPMTVWLRLV